ncbi:Maf family protein [Halobacillus faecis]|uniref:dTTP/UTP pyrophosphatase n=1 Tax=Halobacillus faecis TaxID=360184 RepID=A0A511WRP6_9BACI|nr:Maf family protein [Halobacillus faecis]GEN51922.1 septum formation protein Maf [Halobacillus faecis]
MKRLVLGSQSPRRKELLELAGFEFDIRPSNAEEVIEEGMSPEEAVLHLARVKAENVKVDESEVLLTSDTVVALNGEILGKPKDDQEARLYLRTLSGTTHKVYTGVCLKTNQSVDLFYVQTEVTFYALSEEEVDAYIRTGEVWDKAGGYGIQGKGSLFVEKINGDYYSVVGLPLSRVARELKRLGIFPE